MIQAGGTTAAVGGGSCRIACGSLHLQSSQSRERCRFSMFFTMKSAKQHNFSLLNDRTGTQLWALRKVVPKGSYTTCNDLHIMFLSQEIWLVIFSAPALVVFLV